MKKAILLASAVFTSVLSMGTTATAATINSGWCTREYDPVPYVTVDGKHITAPNQCVANHWKNQGR